MLDITAVRVAVKWLLQEKLFLYQKTRSKRDADTNSVAGPNYYFHIMIELQSNFTLTQNKANSKWDFKDSRPFYKMEGKYDFLKPESTKS